MSMQRNLSGLALAAAAAALFSSSAFAGEEKAMDKEMTEGQVKCSGINSCKGTSECATAESSCKGQNSCAGHGWVHSESEQACTDAGGTVVTG